LLTRADNTAARWERDRGRAPGIRFAVRWPMRGLAAGLIVVLAIGVAAWVAVSTWLGPLVRQLFQP